MLTTPMRDAETNSSGTNLSVDYFFERLCVKDRNFVGESVPLLFVGDRGNGIHSPIKESILPSRNKCVVEVPGKQRNTATIVPL